MAAGLLPTSRSHAPIRRVLHPNGHNRKLMCLRKQEAKGQPSGALLRRPTPLRVQHLAHLPGQGRGGEGLLQEGDPLIKHPVVHDGVVRVAR